MRHSFKQIVQREYGARYKISIRIPCAKGWIENVNIYLWRFGTQIIQKMYFTEIQNGDACFEAMIELENSTLYHYYFSFEANGKFQYYKRENITGDTNVTKGECFKTSVNFNVPEWANGAIGYQIFPDRFCRGKDSVKHPMPRRHLHENWDEQPIIGPDEDGLYNTDFFGGDFAGIKEKIPYLAELGIEIIYINPICRSQSNHRYDTGDYFTPDPYLGTEEELKDLTQEIHKWGMKAIQDVVFNHTGNDSKYFNQYGTYDSVGAYNNPESPYSCYYLKRENGEYECWWNFPNLPVCNKSDIGFRNMIFGEGGAIDKYCEWGFDGLRLDVVDELPDHFTAGIWEGMQRNRPDDFLIVGEVWENPMRKGKWYLHNGREMHTVMNYFMEDALIRYYKYSDVFKLDRVLREILEEYPVETIRTAFNSTSTHDMSRLIEVFGCDVFDYYSDHGWDLDTHGMTEEEKNEWLRNHKMTPEEYEKGKMVMKSYLTAFAFWPGVFTVFYGDEVGMQGIGNLLNRGTYPWGKEDNEILNFYKELIKSRKSENFLRKADVRVKKINYEQFAFERYDETEKLLVIASRVSEKTKLEIPEEYEDAKIVFSTGKNGYANLAPYGAIVLKKQ